MAEETSLGGAMWKGANSFLGVAGLASALGIGIPALVKANDVEDKNGCNGRHGQCSENTLVNRYEMGQSQRIAMLESDRYTDQKIIEAYKQSVADNKALEAKINELAERNSAAHETINRELVAQREAQLIANGNMDKELALLKQADYFNRQLNDCRYVKAKKVVAKDDICPEVMVRYNSWTAPVEPSVPEVSSTSGTANG